MILMWLSESQTTSTHIMCFYKQQSLTEHFNGPGKQGRRHGMLSTDCPSVL